MPTSLHSKEYKALTEMLVNARKRANYTQQQVASRLKRPQSFVAKYEGGERRLDVIEFLEICQALRSDPTDIIRRLTKIVGG